MRANSLGVIGPKVSTHVRAPIAFAPVLLGPTPAASLSPSTCRLINLLAVAVTVATLVYNVAYVVGLG